MMDDAVSNTHAPAPSRICEQVGHDKIYDTRRAFTTDPPMAAWICRRCGTEGKDISYPTPQVSAYDLEREKWGK